jgi:hypothetical protein
MAGLSSGGQFPGGHHSSTDFSLRRRPTGGGYVALPTERGVRARHGSGRAGACRALGGPPRDHRGHADLLRVVRRAGEVGPQEGDRQLQRAVPLPVRDPDISPRRGDGQDQAHLARVRCARGVLHVQDRGFAVAGKPAHPHPGRVDHGVSADRGDQQLVLGSVRRDLGCLRAGRALLPAEGQRLGGCVAVHGGARVQAAGGLHLPGAGADDPAGPGTPALAARDPGGLRAARRPGFHRRARRGGVAHPLRPGPPVHPRAGPDVERCQRVRVPAGPHPDRFPQDPGVRVRGRPGRRDPLRGRRQGEEARSGAGGRRGGAVRRPGAVGAAGHARALLLPRRRHGPRGRFLPAPPVVRPDPRAGVVAADVRTVPFRGQRCPAAGPRNDHAGGSGRAGVDVRAGANRPGASRGSPPARRA